MGEKERRVRSRFYGVPLLRTFWHVVVRRYENEMCGDCGRPVGRHIGTWWHASDDLWQEMTGGPDGVLCPACFADLCDTHGVLVYFAAVEHSRA